MLPYEPGNMLIIYINNGMYAHHAYVRMSAMLSYAFLKSSFWYRQFYSLILLWTVYLVGVSKSQFLS